MKAKPRKVSGLHVSEIQSGRIILTCSPLLIRQRDGSSAVSACWVCAGSPAELCRPPASPSSDPSRPVDHQSWFWCSDLQRTRGLKVHKGARAHSPGLKQDFISPGAEEETPHKSTLDPGDKRLKRSKHGPISIQSKTCTADCSPTYNKVSHLSEVLPAPSACGEHAGLQRGQPFTLT